VRYYFYKMYNAAGMRSSRKRQKKFRRRKEWREEVETATSLGEFECIELYEPQNSNLDGRGGGGELLRRSYKLNRITSRGTEVVDEQSIPAASPRSGFGLRKRFNKLNTDIDTTLMMHQPSSPKRSSDAATPTQSSPPSPMRKIHSCLDFKRSSSTCTNITTNTSKKPSPVKRVSSTASLRNNESSHHDINRDFDSGWQRIVRQDLGMAGDMLLTTMSRLREARMQATSNTSNNPVLSGNNTSQLDHSVEESETYPKDNEDYSSSLKFLLSGIIKRNHLSVDDALINDCRSVAERGQHSLRKETRDAIDSYGEEVERCMDWVASGPVHLCHGSEENHGEDNGISREQVMQRQLDELDKRYTLVKRMKQNMGHTALMLSGGGGELLSGSITCYTHQHIH
jgi:hypothetical protein